jgi:phospholipid/cholesterol/gamma-HCH transport system ATP-binding protein
MRERSGPAVVLEGVEKRFGQQTVLDGVNLTISADESVAVLGRSGTGKSVLLKLIVGLQTPDAGSILLNGQAIGKLSAEELSEARTRVGFLFQEAALYDSLTIEDNVAFPLMRDARRRHNGVRDRVHELLGVVGMEKDAQKRPAEISGGMKKRVGLARALALDPTVLLLDEPTAGLDPITSGEIESLITQLRKDRTLATVVVTHDLHGARVIARRAAFLHEGTIVAQGTFDQVKASTHPVVSQFFDDHG